MCLNESSNKYVLYTICVASRINVQAYNFEITNTQHPKSLFLQIPISLNVGEFNYGYLAKEKSDLLIIWKILQQISPPVAYLSI